MNRAFWLLITAVAVVSFSGCASQAKYEAWSKVEAAKQEAKSSQAKALAQVATTSKDATLAAFAVFTMANLKSQDGATPMPSDDTIEYLRILAPITGQLIGKGIDAQLNFKLAKEESYKYGLTMKALTAKPQVVNPEVVRPEVIVIQGE